MKQKCVTFVLFSFLGDNGDGSRGMITGGEETGSGGGSSWNKQNILTSAKESTGVLCGHTNTVHHDCSYLTTVRQE